MVIYVDGKPIEVGERPPESLGREMADRESVRRWLGHPENWHDSTLFILKWYGLVPTIQRERAIELLRNPADDGILDVVLWQRKLWQDGGKPEPEKIREEQ